MTGFHQIRAFRFPRIAIEASAWELPTGWKPFSSYVEGEFLFIVGRKWHRIEQPQIYTK